ncbi:MAG: UDP-N-acetylmuramate--L-alanine ligase [Clostridia bacterium]|nr:UDP-N-acetylmuramate--L-alanine ligase [Clostridia bacterium]
MKLNLKNYNKIFFVGIGGISMSALALLLKSEGKIVSGSDILKSKTTKKLKKQGIKVFAKHRGSNIKNCDLVVFSGAVPNENPEIKLAIQKNIPLIERSQLLYLISKQYKNVIAISGTHGKTTTTAMIAYIFMICGLNPTVHIGGEFEAINGNIKLGKKDFFITEACEFRDSFLTLKPTVSVINNIELEHLDYFKNFNNEVKSFNRFANKTKKICFVNAKIGSLIKNKDKTRTYGCSNTNFLYARNIRLGDDGKYSFDCYQDKNYIGNFKLNVYGKHNIENALATISVCLEYGIDYNVIYLGLKSFTNVHRRFEIVGLYKNCIMLHDYAHHPTEIFNTIKTCKEVFKKKVMCVFQPHTYSRTKTLIENFSKCFDGLDCLYLLKTYSAREKFEYLGSADYLKDVLMQSKPNFLVKGVFTKKQFIKTINKENLKDYILLFLGAGDIEKIPYKIAKSKDCFYN